MRELLATYFVYAHNPAAGIKKLVQRRSFRQACVGYFVAALGWVVFFNTGDDLSLFTLGLKGLLVFAAEVTAGYFMAALCGLFLDLRRVKVSAAQLFVLLGSAGFIKALLIAFALIAAAWPQPSVRGVAPFWVLFVWVLQLVYLVRGLKRTWKVGTAEAVGAWLFGFVPVGVLFGLVGIFLVWGLILLF